MIFKGKKQRKLEEGLIRRFFKIEYAFQQWVHDAWYKLEFRQNLFLDSILGVEGNNVEEPTEIYMDGEGAPIWLSVMKEQNADSGSELDVGEGEESEQE